MNERSQDIADRWQALQNSRDAMDLEERWREISKYHCPDRGRFDIDESSPDNSYSEAWENILDSTGVECLNVAMNGLHSGLTPPSRPWFRLAYVDEELTRNAAAKKWLESVQAMAENLFRRSNFYSCMHSLYAEIMAFRTGCLYMEQNAKSVIRYRLFTAGEYWIDQDDYGVIDTCYRRIMMTPRQMVFRFGEDKVGKACQSDFKNRTNSHYEVLHAVQPRRDREPGKADKKNMAYESLYIDVSNDYNILTEGGYRQFPYVVPRYNVISNQVYGTGSPGWAKLDQVKMLQDMEESKIRAIHKKVDPPVVAPMALKGSPIRSGHGGVTFYDGQQPDQLRPLYALQWDLRELFEEIQEVRLRIYRGWYYDIFLMLEQSKGNATATEILEKVEEKKLQLGPFIERHQDEVLEPTIEFVVNQIILQGLVPPPPDDAILSEYKIEYISTLAEAQKQSAKRSIDETLAFVGNVAPLMPSVVDIIDFYEAVRQRGDVVGIPGEIIRTDDELVAIRKARAEQEAQQQQMQQASAMVQGAQQLSQTSTDPNSPNALTDIARLLASQTGGMQ